VNDSENGRKRKSDGLRKNWIIPIVIGLLITIGGCIEKSNNEAYFRLYCTTALGENITGNVTIETGGEVVFNSTIIFREFTTIYEEKASGDSYFVVVTVNNITRQITFLPDGSEDLEVSVTPKGVAFQGITD
jgi:hypothetical protein